MRPLSVARRQYRCLSFGMSSACLGLMMAALSPLHAADAEQLDVTALNARIDALQSDLAALSATAASKQDVSLPIHGFADVDFVHDSLQTDNRHDGFAMGNFDLYMLPSFGSNVRGLAELNFEYGETGKLQTDLERLEFGYTFSDKITVWMGRFHTPYGYWNAAFHHGQQIQTSAVRPRFIDFEDAGGVMPAHTIGLQISGHWRAGNGKLGYDLFIGNGDDIVDGVLDFNTIKDRNGKKLVGLNVHYSFEGALEGLTLGVHGYQDETGTYIADVLQRSTRVGMSGAYLVYDSATWQALGEYYHFSDTNQLNANPARSSNAGFLQVAYATGLVTPFVRYEKANLNQQDHYFADQESGRSYQRQAFGVRYDINRSVAAKVEWHQTKDILPTGDITWNGARLQLAASF